MTKENLEHALYQLIKEVMNDSNNIQLDLDTRIEDLQLDSLDFLDFHLQTEKKMNINIPIEKFILCSSIRDLYLMIESLQSETP